MVGNSRGLNAWKLGLSGLAREIKSGFFDPFDLDYLAGVNGDEDGTKGEGIDFGTDQGGPVGKGVGGVFS